MRNVSTAFKNAMRAPVKEIEGIISIVTLDESVDEIVSSGDLVKYTIEGEAVAVGKSVMRKLTATYLGDRNLIDQTVHAKFGVKLANGSYSYIDYGEFIIATCETAEDKESTTITAYDRMIYTMRPYDATAFEYPTTVGGLYEQICSTIGVDAETLEIPFADLEIEADLYSNISGIQYRRIIEEIAILGGQVAMINDAGQLALRSVKTPSGQSEINYDDLKKLTFKAKYGKLNSLVLSRQPQEDNVVLRDETSIEADGLTEIKISNNEIIDKRRELVALDIFPYFNETTYYPFTADTIGLGWFEIGDKVIITDNENVVREARVMGIKTIIDGSYKETIWSTEPTKTQTNYGRAGGLDNRIKNTEIIVDKQQQEITSVVSDLITLDGVTSENFTRIDQDITSIIQSVQTTGGINLLRNSAFYQYDNNGLPTMWVTSGSGNFSIQSSSEAVSKGSLSANVITLNGVTERQTVTVVQDTSETTEENKTYYSFKVLVKKGLLGTATIRVFNDLEDHTITIPAGTTLDYDEVTFKDLLPKRSSYTIELSGSAGSNAVFTDAMFSVGKYPSAWSQANGEILNTNVQINEGGMIVKSNVFAGDYTAITPLEFSGYSKVGMQLVKVFTLNKDQTEVSKLYAKNEISMPPIKIVPITTGSMTGWAFVKRSA